MQIGVKSREQTIRKICDDILELLLIAYTYGCEDVNEMLGTKIAPTYREMDDSIHRKVAGKDFEERVSEYIDQFTDAMEADTPTLVSPPIEEIVRIADTDTHRVYNEAGFTTAKLGGATDKTWVCTFHNSRDTHIYLHDTTLPIDAEFYTYLGNHAMFPGEFGVAEEDCNCLCYCKYSASKTDS